MRDKIATAIVVDVCAVLTAIDLIFVGVFTRNAPLAEDWYALPYLTGERPVLPWLFEPFGEHFIILPKILMTLCYGLTHDFRALAFVCVLILAFASLSLIHAAWSFRGYSRPADCLFPILLLSPGHWANYIYNGGYSSQFVLSTAVAVFLLMAMLHRSPSRSEIVGAILCSIILPLCGAQGWCLAPAGVAWLTWIGWKQRCWLSIAGAAVAGTALWLTYPASPPANLIQSDYVYGSQLIQQAVAYAGVASGPARVPVWAAAAAIGMAAVVGAVSFFPKSRRLAARVAMIAVAAGAVLMLILTIASATLNDREKTALLTQATAALSSWVWCGSIATVIVAAVAIVLLLKSRDVGAVLFLAALAVLAVAVAHGRTRQLNLDPGGDCGDGLWRFRLLLTPFLPAVYFLVEKHGSNGFRRLLPPALATLAILAALTYFPEEMRTARDRAAASDSYIADERAGMPADRLAEKHVGQMFTGAAEPGHRKLFVLDVNSLRRFQARTAAQLTQRHHEGDR